MEERIGLTAARLLQDLMSGKKPPTNKEIRIRSELRIGESSG
jgi:hypothetical protein